MEKNYKTDLIADYEDDGMLEETAGMKKIHVDFISIITNKICARIRVEDIELIEQEGRKIHILTANEEFVCYDKVEALVPVLVGRSFYRAKRGLIVNFNAVSRLKDQEIFFESGRSYALGRNNYIKTRKAFKNYLLGYPPFVNRRIDFSQAAEKNEKILS